MLEGDKLPSSQLMLLVITIILASTILLLPAFPTIDAFQDSWISAIIATVAGMVAAFIVLTLATRFPGETLIEYSKSILGKPLGLLVGTLYFWFYLHLTAILFREIASTISVSSLPRTPIEVLIIVAVVAVAFLVRKGFEVLSRSNIPILGIALSSVILLYILATSEMSIENLSPVMENGVIPAIKGAVTPIGWFGEIVSLAFLLPYMRNLKQAKKAVYLGIIMSGLIFTFVIAATLAVFGPEMTRNISFPTLSIARQINISNFIERIESLLVGGWIVWNFIKTAVFYYITTIILFKLLNLKDYRPLVFPLGILITILALALFRGSFQLADFLAKIWGQYAGVFEFAFPLILLTVAVIRGKRGGTGAAK